MFKTLYYFFGISCMKLWKRHFCDFIIEDVCHMTSSLVMCVDFELSSNGKWVTPFPLVVDVSIPCSFCREAKPTNHQ